MIYALYHRWSSLSRILEHFIHVWPRLYVWFHHQLGPDHILTTNPSRIKLENWAFPRDHILRPICLQALQISLLDLRWPLINVFCILLPLLSPKGRLPIPLFAINGSDDVNHSMLSKQFPVCNYSHSSKNLRQYEHAIGLPLWSYGNWS